MTKRKALVLFLLLVACIAIGGLIVTATKNREPSYQGRRLSEWLDQRRSDIDATQRVYAVRQIGTNALPLLLEWVQSEPSLFEERISTWLSRFHLNPHESKLTRPEEAVEAFTALGEEATPAIPALLSIIDNTNGLNPFWAIEALGPIGKDALPVLVDLLTNSVAHPNCDRVGVAFTFRDLKTNAFLAKPVMLAHIRDSDPQVASAATIVLGVLGWLQQDMALPPDTTDDIVPALCANLDAKNTEVLLRTIHALGNFRSKAVPAVPQLIQNLTSTNQQVRGSAAEALRQIDPKALARAQKQ